MDYIKRQQSPETSQGGGESCLLSSFISGLIGLIVIVGISMVALNYFPKYQLIMGRGNFNIIIKMVGGGLSVAIVGLFLIYGGSKAITTGRTNVEDERGRQTEKRGCNAMVNGIWKILFGALFFAGGVGWITLTFYQEIIPWLGK